MNINDQIKRLRDDPRPDEWKNGLGPAAMEAWHQTCLESADTLEKLNAVYEAAKSLTLQSWNDMPAVDDALETLIEKLAAVEGE